MIEAPEDVDVSSVAKMLALADSFYGRALIIGHHRFIEVAGIMKEYLKILESGVHHYNAAYVAEKIDCIFGSFARDHEEFAKSFVETLRRHGWPI